MKHFFLGLALLAGACSLGDAVTPQAKCEAKAYDDPAVKELSIKMLGGGGELVEDLRAPRRAAIADATRRCLVANGLAAPGGVERMKPR